MKLCIGILVNILVRCSMPGVKNQTMLSALVETIEPDNRYIGNERDGYKTDIISNLVTCKNNFPIRSKSTSIVLKAQKTNINDLQGKFDSVTILLDKDRRRAVVGALREVLRNDSSLRKERKELFQECTGNSVDELLNLPKINFRKLLAGLLLYTIRINDNKLNAEDVIRVKDETFVGQYLNYKVAFCQNEDEDEEYQAKICLLLKELDGLEEYMKKIKNKYDSIPTILYREFLSPFSEYYVPNDVTMRVKVPAKNGKKAEYKIERISSVKLDDILAVSKSIILSGGGGFGKSMMLRNFLISCIDEYENKGLIPFFISVKDYENNYKNLVDYIYDTIHVFWSKVKKDTLEAIFEQGRALLLFDGLDEIQPDNFSMFIRQFNEFYIKYSGNFFVISSRPYSNFQSFIRFKLLELQPFTKSQALDLIDRLNYFADMPSMQRRFKNLLDINLYHTHKGFSDNPLLLSIMLLIFKRNAEVPTIKYEFYQEADNVLSVRHDASKDLIRQLRTGCNASEFSNLFSAFCAITYGENKVTFSQPEMDKYFDDLKNVFGLNNFTVDDFTFDVTNNLCLMYRDGLDYNFIHRSFQEYFCAKFLHGLLDEDLEDLIPMFDKFNINKRDDMTLPTLFDMKPEAVEKYMIIPYLQKLIDFCENNYGVWTFLEKIYPGYEVSDDDVRVIGEAQSNLYYFITNQYGIPVVLLNPDDFPDIENWIKAQKTCSDVVFSQFSHGYDNCSFAYKVDWVAIKKSGQRDLIKLIEDKCSIFMTEYQNIKETLEALKAKKVEQNYSISLAIKNKLKLRN